jgi:diamine N-acetyltransferase
MLTFQFHHYLKPEFVEAYKAATLEHARATRKQEPNVFRFDLLQDKEDPAHFSMFEVYRNLAAREAHLQTAHFLKWKETVFGQEMFARQGSGTQFETLVPLHPPAEGITRDSLVSLREVTAENLGDVIDLKVSPSQQNFVAPNEISVAQAAFEPKAWSRAIYADETAVGYILLYDDPEKPRYYLWRYMVAAEYQGLGFGRQALEQVIAYVRARPNAAEVFLSYVPEEGGPRGFYEKLGFRDTGVEHGGELEMRLELG